MLQKLQPQYGFVIFSFTLYIANTHRHFKNREEKEKIKNKDVPFPQIRHLLRMTPVRINKLSRRNTIFISKVPIKSGAGIEARQENKLFDTLIISRFHQSFEVLKT